MAIPLRDDTPTQQVPWVTLTLIAVNVIVFLFLQPASLQASSGDVLSGRENVMVSRFEVRWGVIPCELQQRKALSDGAVCTGEQSDTARPTQPKVVLVSLITYMFIHGSILHLAGNMLYLWVFGAAVEDRLRPVPFLLLYLVGGVLSVLGHAAFHWHDAVPVLGASGAIAAVMGAFLVLRPRGRILSLVLWNVAYLPAWVLLGLFFATQFLTPKSAGIAWEAHAVGMVVGFLIALVLRRLVPDSDLAPPPAQLRLHV